MCFPGGESCLLLHLLSLLSVALPLLFSTSNSRVAAGEPNFNSEFRVCVCQGASEHCNAYAEVFVFSFIRGWEETFRVYLIRTAVKEANDQLFLNLPTCSEEFYIFRKCTFCCFTVPLPSYIESDLCASETVQHVHRLKRITPGASVLNSFAILYTENCYSKVKNKNAILKETTFTPS